ncbi:MAG TPA: hypothetical protein VFC39_12745 [Acidobacteriaceae bacterium]|nr:hypothetical protein [Acidobacteriaceae bacterium]
MPHSSAASTGNPRTALLILCVAAGGMGALLALLPAAGHDQLWFLLMARRWLDGATLYGPQIFDSNPPAIVWLSSLPVLGRVLHLPATAFAKVLVLLAESASAALSYYFLRRIKSLPSLLEGPALLFAFLVLALVVPARDFGQRDQMLSFLVLPYVLAASIPRRHAVAALARCAAGLLAAGICLKPQYVLIPIAVEAFLLLRPSSRPSARLRHLLRPN